MSPSFSLAAFLAGVVLLCAFLQISQRRLTSMLAFSRASALALAGLAFWQGFNQHARWFYALAALILAVQFYAFPRAIRRIANSFQNPLLNSGTFPLIWSLVIGLLPVAVAVMGFMPLAKNAWPVGHVAMSLAMAVTLLGIWLIIIQRQCLQQIIGFVTFENGLVLAMITMPGMGWEVDIASVILLGLATCLILLGVWRHYALSAQKAEGSPS